MINLDRQFWRDRVWISNRRSRSGGAAIDTVSVAEFLEPEVARCRRHGRSFGVLSFTGIAATKIDAIKRSVRETDRTCVIPQGIVVLLPETDVSTLQRSATRLAASAGIDAGAVGAVTFPDDALTLGHLCALLGAADAIGWAPTAPPRESSAA